MSRTPTLPPAVLFAALAAASIAAGYGVKTAIITSTRHPAASLGGVASRTTRASSPHTPSTSPSPGAAAEVARMFAHAYAGYLDGQLPAGAVKDASAAARAQLGPPIPSPRRTGPLLLRAAQHVPGTLTFSLTLRDREHMFTAQVTLGHTGGRRMVLAVTPPDLDTILAPPPRAIPPPAGSTPAQQAARALLAGNLPWQYGNASVQTISDLTSKLHASLQANPPRVPPAVRRLRPQVRSLAMQRANGGGWQELVVIFDGQQTYELVLTVRQAEGRWLVSAVRLPR